MKPTLYTATGECVTPGRELGKGGEGAVYDIEEFVESVAKIYHTSPPALKQDKLAFMAATADAQLLNYVAWPQATLHGGRGGKVIGFMMPKVSGKEPIHMIYSPAHRLQSYPHCAWDFLLYVARNIASSFATVHEHGHVVGDVNQNSFIVLIFILPMWMNFLLRTLAWQTLLEKTGVINSVLSFFHLPALNIINTPYAIVLGMVYNFLPFMVLPIYNSLIKLDSDVINAARDLGANSVQTFTRVIFPLTIPGVISGITMVFIPALTTFVISNLLGGSKILLIGNVIEQEFTQASNWNLGSGLSLVMMIFIIISMAASALFDETVYRTLLYNHYIYFSLCAYCNLNGSVL